MKIAIGHKKIQYIPVSAYNCAFENNIQCHITQQQWYKDSFCKGETLPYYFFQYNSLRNCSYLLLECRKNFRNIISPYFEIYKHFTMF